MQFSNLLLYGFVLGSPELKLIACVNSQLVHLPPSWDMFHLPYLVIHLECPKLNTFFGFLETFFCQEIPCCHTYDFLCVFS